MPEPQPNAGNAADAAKIEHDVQQAARQAEREMAPPDPHPGGMLSGVAEAREHHHAGMLPGVAAARAAGTSGMLPGVVAERLRRQSGGSAPPDPYAAQQGQQGQPGQQGQQGQPGQQGQQAAPPGQQGAGGGVGGGMNMEMLAAQMGRIEQQNAAIINLLQRQRGARF